MDNTIIFGFTAIFILIIVIIFTLKKTTNTKVQTKDEKRLEIINDYKKQLQDSLTQLKDNKEARIAKKTKLLQKFSKKLALNIFFDKDEIREIILQLSKES